MRSVNSFTAMGADPRPNFERHFGWILLLQEKYFTPQQTHVKKAELLRFNHVSWLSPTLEGPGSYF